ncbi:endonuclease/exonuclease/phosphatase family protein [Henriciella aquimarina]|uniref:endonuclease/exonuclease/phosphatase family protein n=1 Tax=Henriciella aquimarina TaxID=545261 RepID=UPI000A063420|nr:endonuclease/exonuclease/phosphatase family protein [Henriciella aquimarina]
MQRVRIVSWNIRKAVGLDWRRDPERVLRVLKRLEPDIVLLQESDKRLPPRPPALPLDLVRRAGWTAIDADPDTPSIGHHGNAILLKPGIQLKRLVALDLPGLEPRGAVLASVNNTGMSLTLGALHLGLRRRDRLLQMAHVLDAAHQLGGPSIIGGDLNEWRDTKSLLPSGSHWTEIAPGRSFHASAPLFKLDRFLINGIDTIDSYGVLSKDSAERASDHLPIWIDIELNDRTVPG